MKAVIAAADVLNDKVLPFFEQGIAVESTSMIIVFIPQWRNYKKPLERLPHEVLWVRLD